MSELIKIEVNESDIKWAQKKLKGMETKAPRVLKNAINHTAKKARKSLMEGAQRRYTVKNAGFNSRIKIYNATNTKLSASVYARDRTLTLPRFHTTSPKSGVRSEVLKGSGLKEVISRRGSVESGGKNDGAIRAFRAKGGKAAGLIVQRRTVARYPLKVLRSISVPKMLEMVYLGRCGISYALEPEIKRTFRDEVKKEIAKIIK